MNWLPSHPAFDGFYPQAQHWLPLQTSFAEILQAYSGVRGDVFSLTGKGWGKGFYRIEAKSPVFIKCVEESRFEKQREADRIAAYVMLSCGIKTSCCLAGFPITLPEQQYSLFVYPYVNSGFIGPSPANMTKLGELIARTHQCLAQAPFKDQIKSQGLARFSWIESTLDFFASEPIVIPDQASAILQSIPAGFLRVMQENAQPIHGDLNVGNILQDEQDELILIDFENSYFSWSSPLVDLAFVMERFILIREDIDKQACLLSLLQAYKRLSDVCFHDASKVIHVLQALSVRSLLLLTELARQGGEVRDSEWQKFIYLYHATTEYQPLLDEVFKDLKRLSQ
ncbi:phosphotransferase [Thiomicrospira sp. R3]|uniref:phosphotransferase n=1 Tax=Thiomicrospira sp. R3 TaxID=3035472 RepID=UPI00259B217A|nr:phosphotransferase [Thiomicrospira sp. R3]WFE69798.1 phosphotransferase [Thiomicrospira sp. R3]